MLLSDEETLKYILTQYQEKAKEAHKAALGDLPFHVGVKFEICQYIEGDPSKTEWTLASTDGSNNNAWACQSGSDFEECLSKLIQTHKDRLANLCPHCKRVL